MNSYQEEVVLNGLNVNQKQAVERIESSTLVIAGAGSGKTAVLTRRVAYLIAKGEIPGSILCLTFTNKAAKEMNQRIESLLQKTGFNLPYVPIWSSDYSQRPLLCTFHSLGVRILREFYELAGLSKDFTILDSDDQKKIIRDILKEKNLDPKNFSPSLASYFISQCKQELLTSQDSKKLNKDFLPVFHDIYKVYEEKLLTSSSVDFDDLILIPYLLLQKHELVVQTLQKRFQHILVDEFQDTNLAQFQLIKKLMPAKRLEKEKTSLFVVGDDAQSIYGFRGSKVELILSFSQYYPQTKEIILNQNYRSTQPILDLAEKVISQNPKQKKKELFTENPEKVKVCYYLARNEADEAEYILRKIWSQYGEKSLETENQEISFDEYLETHLESEDIYQEGKSSNYSSILPLKSNDPVEKLFDIYLETDENKFYNSISNYNSTSWQIPKYNWENFQKLNDCVVLYRTHAQSRSLEEVFLKYKLPYKLVSGTRFLDRKEIKDVVSILKFISNPKDNLSLSRFLPLIWDGVGPKTMQKILTYLENKDFEIAPKWEKQIEEFLKTIEFCKSSHTNIIDFTKEIINLLGYTRYLQVTYPNKEEFLARMENIGELYSLMLPLESENIDLNSKLSLFLENVSLMGQSDESGNDNTPKVSLMSLHQSKGLEFETVFLVGVEDGLLPHQNSFLEEKGIEEEIRLAYVGVTRAKKYLHLIAADSRVTYGQIKSNPLSRIFRPFLDEYCQRQKI